MRRVLLAAIGAALALSLSVAGAYFTGQVQVPDNVIQAGSVSVSAEPTSAALSIETLAPGVDQIRDLKVRNTGALPSDMVVTGAKKAGVTALYDALTCRVTREGTVLYDGPMPGLRTAPVRVAPGEETSLRFAVGLPAITGNELADDYVRMSLYVDAEQAH